MSMHAIGPQKCLFGNNNISSREEQRNTAVNVLLNVNELLKECIQCC